MKYTIKYALSATLLATVVNTAMAAGESVDLSIKGTINPVACTPTLSESGTFNYGEMSTSMLSATEYTALESKTLELAIQCDGLVRMAISAHDSRPETQAGTTGPNYYAPIDLFNQTHVSVMGLGLAGDKPIGGYAVRIVEYPLIDDDIGLTISSSTSGDTWVMAHTNAFLSAPDTWISWSQASTSVSVPKLFKNLAAQLSIQAYINKAKELDLTQPVILDGLANIELIYL